MKQYSEKVYVHLYHTHPYCLTQTLAKLYLPSYETGIRERRQLIKILLNNTGNISSYLFISDICVSLNIDTYILTSQIETNQ
jgi:hypothetical protein